MLPAEFAEAVADPPRVHPSAWGGGGVWRTEDSCYAFIGEHAQPGSNTLETGLGLSTVAFAMLGCRHTSVFQNPSEGEILREWASTRGLNLDLVDLRAGGSHVVLPGLLDDPPLDFVFIDGGHGYPVPQIDFLYAAGRLKRGGVLVIDDTALWAPRQLRDYLDADHRWSNMARTEKWVGYRRESEGPLAEAWTNQPFGFVQERTTITRRARAFAGRVRSRLSF